MWYNLGDMSDFEQDFLTKVKGSGEAAVEAQVVREGSAEKKSVDKRWFAIGGLIVVLVVVLVALNVFGANRGRGGVAGEGFVPYAGAMVGLWSCDDGTEMGFYSDRTYSWTSRMNGGDVAEAGNFAEEAGVISIARLSYFRDGQIVSSSNKETDFEVQRDGDTVTLAEVGGEMVFLCERSGNG